MYAVKSITQPFLPNPELLAMMETFRKMVNFCIRVGLDGDVSSMKKLSLLTYPQLKECGIPTIYRLMANAQAAGRLAQMKKDLRKGKKVKSPFVRRPYLVSCYGFKINGMLLSFPVQPRQFVNILLTDHTVQKLQEGESRSFTITPTSLSISVRNEVEEIIPENAIGIDRNLRNVTISTSEGTVMYRTDKVLSIGRNTRYARAGFKRFDVRVKNRFFVKLRQRQTRRVNTILHKISKDIVQRAFIAKSMIVFEDLKGIRKLYRKGNGQGREYRGNLNSWPFYELQRQIQYKAAWYGIPVQFVDPKRTSRLCPICGERIQEDRQNRRKVLCSNCGKSMDRDVIASMNVARKAWSRFCHARGLPGEAVKGNADFLQPLILRVNGSKLVEGSA